MVKHGSAGRKEKKTDMLEKRWIGIPLVIAAFDGAVKKCAEKKLKDGKTKDLFGGRIRLELLHNPGVALGALGKKPELVLVVNGVMLGIAADEFVHSLKKDRETPAKTGLALLIGGGASNLIDRLWRGYVTDYFSIHVGARFRRLGGIVFNISDFCVFAGSLLYVFGRCKRS